MQFTLADGTVKEVSLETNASSFSGPSEHMVENIGKEVVRVIQVELK